ncbi:MAG TPA: hypothetical protein EYP22_04475 [Methanosarcinales archaeon]|nr:hypothetical protein [Methanosarcinales archaeon]
MLEVPLYKQEKENFCELACLCMVFEFYGLYVDEKTLIEEIGLENNDYGISPIELSELASTFGLVVRLEDNYTMDQLQENIYNETLVIVLIDPGVLDGDPWLYVAHFVVVTGGSSDTVYLNDPEKGKISMSKECFEACWKICDRCAIVPVI